MTRILCINTHGPGRQDELRTRRLLGRLDAEVTYYDLDRRLSRQAGMRVVRQQLAAQSWDLVYQEGTGIAGGLPLIQAARQRGIRYVVSSGDPVGGFFRITKGPLRGAVFSAYERSLYRHCAGFIGWTPYLAGAALHLGAPRAATVEGAVETERFTPRPEAERQALKQKYGLQTDHLVCGVVGSLNWVARQGYGYGLELIETLKRLKRPDVSVLIVGDGDGRARLMERIPDALKSRVVFTGRLPEEEVVGAMNAMDIGFITQTLDRLGSFRLTTKLPEYLACGLPVAMSPIPGYYDYVLGAGWSLPPQHPASAAFAEQCAAWLDGLDRSEIVARREPARQTALARFDYCHVGPKFTAFLTDMLQGTRHDTTRYGK